MKRFVWLLRIITAILLCVLPNAYLFIQQNRLWYLAPVWILLFLIANLVPLIPAQKLPNTRLLVCSHGAVCLIFFLCSVCCSVVYHLALIPSFFPQQWGLWAISVVFCVIMESILFWNGMISVYCASVQLGVRNRAIGILCGMIPIVHLVVLIWIIKTVLREVSFETEKSNLNDTRQSQQICATRYPLLLVHGVFFRDFKHLNYWGRIPGELQKNGAVIYFGDQQSASSVADSAKELSKRIKEIIETTHCQKVNIIAHSKGGLDSRYAVCYEDAAPYVASITTINTPHRGCGFADYLLTKIPVSVQQKIAAAYNAAMKKLGDSSPDFMAAVRDLTAEACIKRDCTMGIPDQIFCQSVGSKLNRAVSGKFPLNFSYPLVKYFDGPNDGLVSESSFKWGEHYTYLTVTGNRGISHGDMIDLNRENIPGFDVREWYVNLVSDLKDRGL
jgi:triacylglycerol lipase